MRKAKERTSEILKYHWNNYSELARQRSEIQDNVRQALTEKCISYEMKNWQRVVRYTYCLHPLSVVGSLRHIGGRFNTGQGVNPEVPFFSGLYMAKNKDTALQEYLGQESVKPNMQLTSLEMALAHPGSVSVVSVSGKLDKVFDLTQANNLLPLIELIKHFTLSKELIELSKMLSISGPQVIKTKKLLLNTLLDREWRAYPTNYDVPSNSQIFGHLIYSAGIEGILYPSKFTDAPCLVIYPKNFIGTDSFIQLDDETPHLGVPNRLDAITWRLSEIHPAPVLAQ